MTEKSERSETTSNKAETPSSETPRITNDEKVEVNEVVNKKLTAMSKETKARKKKKLEKPPKDEHQSTVSTISDNQVFLLLGVVGVIIAAVSLYYQRKSVVKDDVDEHDEKPVTQHVTQNVRTQHVRTQHVPEALIKW